MDSNAITPMTAPVLVRSVGNGEAPAPRDQREGVPVQTLRATPVVERSSREQEQPRQEPALESILERLGDLRANGGPALSFEKVPGEGDEADRVLLREGGEEQVLREITQEELRELGEKLDRFQAAANILKGLFVDEEA